MSRTELPSTSYIISKVKGASNPELAELVNEFMFWTLPTREHWLRVCLDAIPVGTYGGPASHTRPMAMITGIVDRAIEDAAKLRRGDKSEKSDAVTRFDIVSVQMLNAIIVETKRVQVYGALPEWIANPHYDKNLRYWAVVVFTAARDSMAFDLAKETIQPEKPVEPAKPDMDAMAQSILKLTRSFGEAVNAYTGAILASFPALATANDVEPEESTKNPLATHPDSISALVNVVGSRLHQHDTGVSKMRDNFHRNTVAGFAWLEAILDKHREEMAGEAYLDQAVADAAIVATTVPPCTSRKDEETLTEDESFHDFCVQFAECIENCNLRGDELVEYIKESLQEADAGIEDVDFTTQSEVIRLRAKQAKYEKVGRNIKAWSDISDRALKAEAEVKRCHERLEIDHDYRGPDLERHEIPMEERKRHPDGIECRDETIKLQKESIEKLKIDLAERDENLAQVRADRAELAALIPSQDILVTLNNGNGWSSEDFEKKKAARAWMDRIEAYKRAQRPEGAHLDSPLPPMEQPASITNAATKVLDERNALRDEVERLRKMDKELAKLKTLVATNLGVPESDFEKWVIGNAFGPDYMPVASVGSAIAAHKDMDRIARKLGLIVQHKTNRNQEVMDAVDAMKQHVISLSPGLRKRHPTPWFAVDKYIKDANGDVVLTVCYDAAETLSAVIVRAVNGNPRDGGTATLRGEYRGGETIEVVRPGLHHGRIFRVESRHESGYLVCSDSNGTRHDIGRDVEIKLASEVMIKVFEREAATSKTPLVECQPGMLITVVMSGLVFKVAGKLLDGSISCRSMDGKPTTLPPTEKIRLATESEIRYFESLSTKGVFDKIKTGDTIVVQMGATGDILRVTDDHDEWCRTCINSRGHSSVVSWSSNVRVATEDEKKVFEEDVARHRASKNAT